MMLLNIDETIAKEKEEAKRLRKIIETGYDGEISIEAMFCDDTDAIKEAYERFENCAKEHKQIAEWLEELKDYRDKNKLVVRVDVENIESVKDKCIELAKEQYNKAIDDFTEELKDYFVIPHDVRVIEMKAEQLKAGGENEDCM